MIKMSLGDIHKIVGGTLFGDENVEFCGICTDSRSYNQNELFIALTGEKFDGNDFAITLKDRCDAFLLNRHIEGLNQIVVDDTLQAFGKLAANWKNKINPMFTVGVTGSVGKTTTKELISSVLQTKYKTHSTKGNFNNYIGVPITLIRIEEGTEAVVCEMGMSARGEIENLTNIVKPNVAVITNIGTSHIEKLGSREEICRAKLEILSGLEEGGTVILDGDEPLFKTDWAKELLCGKKVVYVGFGTKNDVYPLDIYKAPDCITFDAIFSGGEERIKVPAIGDHFIKNALFAVACGIECGLKGEEIKEGILQYKPTGLRQRVYEAKGINIIADCYNASPESMNASLKVLSEFGKKRKIAVLGDMLELGAFSEKSHREVGAFCVENRVDELVTFGNEAKFIAEGAISCGMKKENIHSFTDKDKIAEFIKNNVSASDTVLFKASRRMKLEEVIALSELSE